MGAVAVLMLVTGGQNALDGIQSLTILVAAPFVVIMVMLCLALFKNLRRDPVILRGIKGTQVLEQAVDWAREQHGDDFYVKVGAFAKAAEEPKDKGTPAANGRAVREPGDLALGEQSRVAQFVDRHEPNPWVSATRE